MISVTLHINIREVSSKEYLEERMISYLESNGFTDISTDNYTLSARRGWISGGLLGNLSSLAPFYKIYVDFSSVDEMIVKFSTTLIFFVTILASLAFSIAAFWWMPLPGRAALGIGLGSLLFLFTVFQGILRAKVVISQFTERSHSR